MKPFLPALAVALAAAGIASAATDGTAGPDSTATVDMSLTVSNPAPQIQISGLQDFDFDLAPGEEKEERYEACVYVSQPGVTYSLSIGGTDLTDGSTNYRYQIDAGPEIISGVRALEYVHGVDSNPTTRSGYTPSNTPGCPGMEYLSVRLFLFSDRTATRTNGSATAKVTLTVKPD